jgi:lauroyl/myristoyl acyltransferase
VHPTASPPHVRLPLLSKTDVFEVMAIAVLAPLAWLAPERAWPRLSHTLTLAITRGWPAVTRARVATLARALGPHAAGRSLEDLRDAIIDGYMEERLQILRAHRPGGWRPRLRLVGRAHLDAALAHGRGAVLWTAPFSYADLVTKMALHQAGVALSHLSAFSRGFSPNSCLVWDPTRFGTQVLSPLRTRVEDRHLRERIALPRDGSLAYVRRVERRLRENGVVSIRAGEAGHRTVELPFLDGCIRLATGAPSIALGAGAALLPVFTVRTGPGAFDVVIEPTLACDDAASRHDAVDALTRRYGRLLESYVLHHPQLWSGWYTMRLDGAPFADAPSSGVAPSGDVPVGANDVPTCDDVPLDASRGAGSE